jgi:hypothetical protein
VTDWDWIKSGIVGEFVGILLGGVIAVVIAAVLAPFPVITVDWQLETGSTYRGAELSLQQKAPHQEHFLTPLVGYEERNWLARGVGWVLRRRGVRLRVVLLPDGITNLAVEHQGSGVRAAELSGGGFEVQFDLSTKSGSPLSWPRLTLIHTGIPSLNTINVDYSVPGATFAKFKLVRLETTLESIDVTGPLRS